MKQVEKLTRTLKENLANEGKNPKDWRIAEKLPDSYILINIKTNKTMEYPR